MNPALLPVGPANATGETARLPAGTVLWLENLVFTLVELFLHLAK
jgi:hypothetical protein